MRTPQKTKQLGASAAAPMEDDSAAAATAAPADAAPPAPSSLPEVELYAHLLVAVYALDQGAEAEVG